MSAFAFYFRHDEVYIWLLYFTFVFYLLFVLHTKPYACICIAMLKRERKPRRTERAKRNCCTLPPGKLHVVRYGSVGSESEETRCREKSTIFSQILRWSVLVPMQGIIIMQLYYKTNRNECISSTKMVYKMTSWLHLVLTFDKMRLTLDYMFYICILLNKCVA